VLSGVAAERDAGLCTLDRLGASATVGVLS
jgi:hypothetical protein